MSSHLSHFVSALHRHLTCADSAEDAATCGTVISMSSGQVNLGRRGRRRPGHGQLAFEVETLVSAGILEIPGEHAVVDAPSVAAPQRHTRGPARCASNQHGAESSPASWQGGGRPGVPGARLSEAMLSVGGFHQAFGLPRASLPNVDIPADLAKLRVDLLREEVGEFADATAARNIVGIADALADILYVAYGAAITYGIDLDAVLREVHRSNMSKLDEHGRPCYRADGKVLKSARYSPPDVSKVLLLQPPLPF